MEQRVKKVVAEESERFKLSTAEAVKSRAYLYPLEVLNPAMLPNVLD